MRLRRPALDNMLGQAYRSYMARRDDVYNITEAGISAADDRDGRTRRYLFSMAIRTGCFIGALLVDGWLRWVLFAGAVVLPYVAVVVANQVTAKSSREVIPPFVLHDPPALPPGHPDRTGPAEA
jgi:hypothetical protein